jgi:hypothetical protein
LTPEPPLVRALWVALFVAAAADASAQQPADAPPQPVDRIAVGGEITATYGSLDPGFFNYATYAYDPLRNVRVVFDASVRPMRQLELLAQVRTDGLSQARMAALYLRVRPWADRAVDLQVGRVPTVFGLFGRNGYGSDSALLTRPLAYSYLLSLRRDAVPATVADLLRMRGRGWLSSFALGNPAPGRGLPIVNTDMWDTGVQLRLGHGPLEWAGALTTGSLGSPRLADDNDGRTQSTRLTWRWRPGLTVGGSAAQGAYLSSTLDPLLPAGERAGRYGQRAFAADVEASGGRWMARGEVVHSRWRLPPLTGELDARHVGATVWWGEARVRLAAGLDLAVRGERLGFSSVSTAAGVQPWEAPVTRLESGLAFVPVRHLRLKIGVQRNRRPDGGRVRHDTLLASQVAVWF